MEEKLIQYVEAHRAQGHAIPTILLTLHASKIAQLQELQEKYPDISKAKFSRFNKAF